MGISESVIEAFGAISRGITGRQSHSRKNPSSTGDKATKNDKLRENIARYEAIWMQKERENGPRRGERPAGPKQGYVNLRAKDDECRRLRVELYLNSLLCFEQDTDAAKSSNPVLQRGSAGMRHVDALCKQYRFPTGDQREFRDLLDRTVVAIASNTLTLGAWLFYQAYLLRNATLMVYHNCRRLQTVKPAGDWFSILALEPESDGGTRVVNLRRVQIDDVREVVERLSSFVNILQTLLSERPVPDLDSTLTRMSDEVHLLYQKIFERLGLEEMLSNNWCPSDLELNSTFNSRSSGASAYLVDVFAQWWCATRALDVGILGYEQAHICQSEPTFSINLDFKIPQIGAFQPQNTSQRPG